jgi:YidC/Oxa1 family membrane protein insertase
MPLIKMLKVILGSFYVLTGNYGWALILLSFTVTLIMLPLFWLAEKIQDKDRRKKNQMMPELQKLKAVANGQKKYFYTKRIYQQFGYHPIHSLSSLLGLLIQIPFFIAAYQMLRSYSGFDGVSFGFIANLMQPDGLLHIGSFHVNLLPFVMTGVNLLAGFLYSRGMERSEKIQLFSIATLFFFLLYNQPAALVLYWTMNNIFAIIRGKVFKKIYITEVATHHQPESSFLLELYRSSQYFFHHYYKFMRYILCLCCLYFTLIISFNYTVSIAESFIKLFIIGSIIALILYHATQYIKNHYNLVFLRNWLIIIFSIVAPILFFIPSAIMLGEIEAGGGSYIIGGMLFINLLMVVYFPFKNRATAKIKLLDLKLLNIVGLGALLFILSLILFWLPLNIYLSSPQEFLFSNIIQILQKNIAIFVIVITLGAILIIGSPRQIKFILVTLLVGSMLFALVNGICFARQFGTMHAFTFMQPNIVATGWRNIFEFIIF